MKKFTTRLVFIGLFLALCFSQSFAQNGPIFTSVQGRLVRVTPRLADIDKNSMYGQPLQITRKGDGFAQWGAEPDRAEEKIFPKTTGDSKYEKAREELMKMAAAKYAQQRPNNLTPNTPTATINVNMDGQFFPGFAPSDNNMAAGPNHIIQMTNHSSGSAFRIWNKTGTPLTGSIILSSVTGITGGGDPVVVYDQLADRWLISEFGWSCGIPTSSYINTLIIAVSTTGDPTGTWKIYSYCSNVFASGYFVDYPKYGVWNNAYYATSNDFNTSGTAYLGSSIYAFDRTAMLAGAPTATMIRTQFTGAGNRYYSMAPVCLEGPNVSNQSGLFALLQDNTWVGAPADSLILFEFTPNFAVPSNSVVGPFQSMVTLPYNTNVPALNQLGSTQTFQSLSQRLMHKVIYRNFGAYESIVCNTTDNVGGTASVHWWELRRPGSGNWSIYQEGIWNNPGFHRFMGAIAINAQGTIGLLYNTTGSTIFPSLKFTGRNACDPLGQMTLAEQTVIDGTTFNGNNRYGDYNTLTVDPSNGTFWGTGQYNATGYGTFGNWVTRIVNFTLTNPCAGPVLQANGATITAESCVPNNGVIDAGETVTVNFCIQNIGTTPTSNLVGTLLPTGGVSTPSGPQNYGAIAPNATVCRSFTFNNSGICGNTITASIQLQDGATNYGTVTYNFTLGTLNNVTLFSENFDGVSAPALPAGWVATQGVNVTGAPFWVTSNSGTPTPVAVSLPNSIFTPDPNNLLDNLITTPIIAIPGGSGTRRVTFQNNYNLESTFDGGVLEISINGGGFQDIITAGGSFVAGGYNGTISTSFGNPIAGRQAWTGNSNGFITTTVNLPAAAYGQNIQLRFRMGSDNSVAAVGWRVDDVSVISSAYTCCGTPPPCSLTCPANVTVNNTAGQCGASVTLPPVTATGACGNITYSPASGSFFPIGNTTVTVTSQSGSTCSFIVRVVDAQPPTTTCPGNQTRSTNLNACTYTAVGTEFDATATDNCPGVTKAYTLSGVTTGSGTTLAGKVFNNGVTTVTWTSTDAAGNTSSCSFTVTVNDTQNPGMTCPGNATRTTSVNVCTYVTNGTEFDGTATDNCPGVTKSYTLSGATTGTGATTLAAVAFNTGVTTVVWKATDAAGNTTTCSFTVTINDGALPIVTHPSNRTVCEGSNATFTVVGTTGATLTYQWQQWNGTAWVNIAGATASSYTVNNTTVAMNTNSFRCILTTVCGNSITSNFASLYVNKLPVITLSTSRSPDLIPGQFLTITANVNPTGGTIIWRKNGNVINIPNTTNPYDAFSIPNLTVDDIGTYTATYTDLNGCSSTAGSVSITAKSYDKLFVYPNPNNGQFQVRFFNNGAQSVTVNIYDSKGARIYQRSLVTGALSYSRIDVDIQKYSAGVYMVELVDASGNRIGTSKRFMKGY
jgi:hypothetical protein